VVSGDAQAGDPARVVAGERMVLPEAAPPAVCDMMTQCWTRDTSSRLAMRAVCAVSRALPDMMVMQSWRETMVMLYKFDEFGIEVAQTFQKIVTICSARGVAGEQVRALTF